MLDNKVINNYNTRLMDSLSFYLNSFSSHINEAMVIDMKRECGISDIEAYKLLLFYSLGFEMDNDGKNIFKYYLDDMVKKLDINKYKNNLYYTNIKIDNIKYNNWEFQYKEYQPYEAFVYNDLVKYDDERIIPQIGYFDEKFIYPCIMQNNREWMLITPNEIETMTAPINEAFGDVLVNGLGLGYFPYMISLKPEVNSIIIIEKDKSIIELFEKYILPQFEYKNKISIINEDAFSYAEHNTNNYTFVFTDIWHDPSDGVELYLKYKKLEKENAIYRYWIEETIKCYI